MGGSVTLTALMEAMHSLVKALPRHQTCTFRAMLEQLKYFAGVQIRNAASVAGNICTGSPISDVNPLYMACGATFTAVGKGTPEHQASALTHLIACPLPVGSIMHGTLPLIANTVYKLWLSFGCGPRDEPVGSAVHLCVHLKFGSLPGCELLRAACKRRHESCSKPCCRVHQFNYSRAREMQTLTDD